jgi:hypothetical protein
MTKWLVIGGVAALAYLLVTSKHVIALQPGGPARPLPQAPPVQNPAPPSQPQETVVGGANSQFLRDAAAAAGIAGTLADVGRKLGLFGSPDAPSGFRQLTPDEQSAVAQAQNGFPNDFPNFAAGAAFF